MPKNTPPGDIDALTELIIKASWRLRRGGKKDMEALGLTFGQARALRFVVRHEAGLRMGDLAQLLEIVPRSATTAVDTLEAAGVVARTPDPVDGRSVLVAATPVGTALIERIDARKRANATALFSGLEKDERGELVALLTKVVDPQVNR